MCFYASRDVKGVLIFNSILCIICIMYIMATTNTCSCFVYNNNNTVLYSPGAVFFCWRNLEWIWKNIMSTFPLPPLYLIRYVDFDRIYSSYIYDRTCEYMPVIFILHWYKHYYRYYDIYSMHFTIWLSLLHFFSLSIYINPFQEI